MSSGEIIKHDLRQHDAVFRTKKLCFGKSNWFNLVGEICNQTRQAEVKSIDIKAVR